MLRLLSQIAEWKLEAKLEDNARYFFQVPEVGRLLDGSRSYVIGRKGTGKTAIAQYILQRASYDTFVQSLSFKNFPFNDLYRLSNDRFTPPNQFISIWKYLILSFIARMMSMNEGIAADLRSRLGDIFPRGADETLPRTLSKWTSRSWNFNILGTGLGITEGTTNANNESLWSERADILEELIHEYLDDSQYILLFDELDEDYKEIMEPARNTLYLSLITSLFKAIQDIRSRFPQPRFKIFPIIFLRDDIFELLSDSDRTKWYDLRIDLNWQVPKIKQLLAFRISRSLGVDKPTEPFDDAWNRVFYNSPVGFGTRQIKKMHSFEYITRSTHLRPRDYIRYIQACSEEAGVQCQDKVTAQIVKFVDKAFSNYLKSEIEDEIQPVIPEIRDVLSAISHTRKQVFSLE